MEIQYSEVEKCKSPVEPPPHILRGLWADAVALVRNLNRLTFEVSLDDLSCGHEIMQVAKLQHPPVTGQGAEQIQALPHILKRGRWKVAVLGFLMVNVRIENLCLMGSDKILQAESLALY
jgi:hypothetical protein